MATQLHHLSSTPLPLANARQAKPGGFDHGNLQHLGLSHINVDGQYKCEHEHNHQPKWRCKRGCEWYPSAYQWWVPSERRMRRMTTMLVTYQTLASEFQPCNVARRYQLRPALPLWGFLVGMGVYWHTCWTPTHWNPYPWTLVQVFWDTGTCANPYLSQKKVHHNHQNPRLQQRWWVVPLERVEERWGKIWSILQDQLFFFFVEIWCVLLSHHNNVIESLANQHWSSLHVFYFTLVVPYEHFTEPLTIYDKIMNKENGKKIAERWNLLVLDSRVKTKNALKRSLCPLRQMEGLEDDS